MFFAFPYTVSLSRGGPARVPWIQKAHFSHLILPPSGDRKPQVQENTDQSLQLHCNPQYIYLGPWISPSKHSWANLRQTMACPKAWEMSKRQCDELGKFTIFVVPGKAGWNRWGRREGVGFQHDCPLSLCILLGVQKSYINIFLPGWNKGTFVNVGRWSTFYLPIY